MHFEGTVAIQAPPERVWAFLTDPEKVSTCAPGLESVEILVPGQRFRAVASIGFGSVRARFVSDVDWLDLEAPRRARMKVHGTAPGSAMDATSEMRLSAEGLATRMDWSAEVSVVGAIASLAARLMGGVAQRLTDGFFDAVRQKIEGEEAAQPSAFRFGPVALEQAAGKILGHNVSAPDGSWSLRKGRALSDEDVARLRALGRSSVYVAQLSPGDVAENEAARRVAEAALGPGLRLTGAASGRANLVAAGLGLLRVDALRLERLNESQAVTIATLRTHTPVRAGQLAATVKVIPFAVPEPLLRDSEKLLREGGPLLRVDPLPQRLVGLTLTGSRAAESRVRANFEAPLRSRLEALGSSLGPLDFVAIEEPEGGSALAEILRRQVNAGCSLVLVAGETAIVDREDIAPRALLRAGGELLAFGAPVDPGNLLLLGRLGSAAVLGLPGCARSPKTNVVDLILPRLLAGEPITREDLAALGHGGLLEDVPERGAPRDESA